MAIFNSYVSLPEGKTLTGVGQCPFLGICFTSRNQISVGDYIPNNRMFNWDIYQPLFKIFNEVVLEDHQITRHFEHLWIILNLYNQWQWLWRKTGNLHESSKYSRIWMDRYERVIRSNEDTSDEGLGRRLPPKGVHGPRISGWYRHQVCSLEDW